VVTIDRTGRAVAAVICTLLAEGDLQADDRVVRYRQDDTAGRARHPPLVEDESYPWGRCGGRPQGLSTSTGPLLASAPAAGSTNRVSLIGSSSIGGRAAYSSLGQAVMGGDVWANHRQFAGE